MASRTWATHVLALGPAAVELEVEGEEEGEEERVLEDDVGDEAELFVEDEEPEAVGPSGESEPHPTRARTAKPAAARVR